MARYLFRFFFMKVTQSLSSFFIAGLLIVFSAWVHGQEWIANDFHEIHYDFYESDPYEFSAFRHSFYDDLYYRFGISNGFEYHPGLFVTRPILAWKEREKQALLQLPPDDRKSSKAEISPNILHTQVRSNYKTLNGKPVLHYEHPGLWLPPGPFGPSEEEKIIGIGDYYFCEGNYFQAIEQYSKAVVIDSENPQLYWALGRSLEAAGDYSFAAACIRRALDLDPQGLSLQALQKTRSCNELNLRAQTETLKLFLKDYPFDGDARLVYALQLLLDRRHRESKQHLEILLEKQDDPAARILLESLLVRS